VFVDTPGVDPTQSFTFLITPPLSVSSINPGAALAEMPFTIVLNGANFIDGAQVFLGDTLVEATVVSSTQMVSNIPASLAGRYNVHVVNPGGATSAAKTLDVENPVPQISSLSPGTVPLISPGGTARHCQRRSCRQPNSKRRSRRSSSRRVTIRAASRSRSRIRRRAAAVRTESS